MQWCLKVSLSDGKSSDRLHKWTNPQWRSLPRGFSLTHGSITHTMDGWQEECCQGQLRNEISLTLALQYWLVDVQAEGDGHTGWTGWWKKIKNGMIIRWLWAGSRQASDGEGLLCSGAREVLQRNIWRISKGSWAQPPAAAPWEDCCPRGQPMIWLWRVKGSGEESTLSRQPWEVLLCAPLWTFFNGGSSTENPSPMRTPPPPPLIMWPLTHFPLSDHWRWWSLKKSRGRVKLRQHNRNKMVGPLGLNCSGLTCTWVCSHLRLPFWWWVYEHDVSSQPCCIPLREYSHRKKEMEFYQCAYPLKPEMMFADGYQTVWPVFVCAAILPFYS